MEGWRDGEREGWRDGEREGWREIESLSINHSQSLKTCVGQQTNLRLANEGLELRKHRGDGGRHLVGTRGGGWRPPGGGGGGAGSVGKGRATVAAVKRRQFPPARHLARPFGHLGQWSSAKYR